MLQAARAGGIDFLEVARYNDESGSAPIPTGYSEVVFGEVFAASGWPRDEVTIATKLWWEFWPGQTAEQELEASLERTGLERFDFVYCDPPPPELPMADVVGAVAELVSVAACGPGASSTGPPSASPRPGGWRASWASRRRAPRSCPTASSRATGSRARR